MRVEAAIFKIDLVIDKIILPLIVVIMTAAIILLNITISDQGFFSLPPDEQNAHWLLTSIRNVAFVSAISL
jgi:hypothetical protein